MSELIASFSNNFWQSCWNCTICARGNLWRKISCSEKIFFMKFSRTVSKNLPPGCCCSTFPKEKFCDIPFLWRRKQVAFGFLWKFFSIFVRKFLSNSSKLYSRCREVHFSLKGLPMEKTNCFFKFGPSIFFCNFECFSRQVYKICILRVHGNTLKKKCFLFWQVPFYSFSEFDRSIFQLSYKHFLSVWLKQHSMYPEQRFDQN